MPPAAEVQSFNHGTAKEVPSYGCLDTETTWSSSSNLGPSIAPTAGSHISLVAHRAGWGW